MIRVGVVGATGKMGREVCRSVAAAPDLELVAAVSEADQVSFRLRVEDATKTVVWGGSGDGATKAKLVAILASQPGSTIDVSVPSSPVTR